MTISKQENAEPPADGAAPPRSEAILRLLDRPVTPADLAAGAELAARPAFARGVRPIGLLMFRMGEETAALPATLLRRVAPAVRARPIPHISSGIMRGLCNIRGELLLCGDLHRLLGLPAREKPESSPSVNVGRRCMVVIGSADNSWAFEVDAVIGIAHVDPATIRQPPVTVALASGSSTKGVTEIEGRQVTVLDGERIVAGFKAAIP